MRDFIRARVERYDGIIISDYGKGCGAPEELLDALAERKRKVVYVVDPKKENYGSYRFPTLVTPNKAEASEASGIAIVDEATLCSAGATLCVNGAQRRC